MSKFTIYSPDGTALYTGTPTFTGQYMKPGMVEFREVSSPSVLDFRTGCYLGYESGGSIVPVYSRTGFVYKMYSVPQVKKQARPYSHGAAFVYQSVQLYDASKMLEFCPFRDLVAGDNRIHFSTQPSISTFEGVDGLASRFQACLEDMYGAGTWQVRVATTEEGLSPEMANLMAEAREFTVSGLNILECLDKVYEIWPEVGWIYKVESVEGVPTDTIVIGGGGLNANYGTYAYGKGKGLKSITRTVANADELANRIFAYGSSRNMLPGWYNNQSIKDAQSVDIQNLMIPVSSWGTTDVDGIATPDASKAYVEDQASIDRLGLRPTTVYFDGSGEYPEIYPSIRNKTIGQLRNAIGSQYADYYPNPSIYTDPYERIDRVLSVDGSFDSGLVGMAGKSASVSSSEVLGDMTDSDTLEGGTNTSIVLAMRTFEMTKTCATDLYVSMAGDGTITTTGDNVSVYFAISIQKGDGTDFTEVKRQIFELKQDENGAFKARTVSTVAKETPVAVNDIIRVFLSLSIMNNSAVDISYTYSVSPRFNFSASWSRKKTFTITLRQLGFDIGEQAALGDGKSIAMRSGKCTGRTFTIKDVQYDAVGDVWVLECFRSEDESLSQWFPNTDYPIRGQEVGYDGDEFVLLDIAMPELYISMAEGELLQAAQDLLLDTATERWQYVPDIDAKFMVENNRTIRSGEYMTLLDMDFIEAEEGTTSYFKTSNDVYLLTSHGEKIRLDDGSGSVVAALVDTIVINEGEAAIPTYKVTLRDRKRKTWTDSQGAEAPTSKSVGSITEAQVEESYSSGGDSFFMLDEDGNITLKSQYQNLWVPGWLAAGGVGDEGGGGGGGGVSYLRELTDIYHSSSSVLRADGTGAVVGDALVYSGPTLGWVAAAQTGGISSVVLSAGSTPGTLVLTVDNVAGSGVSVPGLGSFAFKSSLDQNDIPSLSGLYLPLTGGELSGDLRLKGAANYGRKLLFGDGNYAYLHEDTDDHLKIYGDKGIELSTGSGYGVTINGQPLDWFVVETIDNNPTLKLNPRYAGLWAEGWVAAGGAGSGSGGGGSNVSVESLADTTAQVSRIAKITIDGTDTYLYNDVAWGTATYTNNTVDVKINGTTKRLCLDGYSSGGSGGGVSSVTLAEGTANGTLRLYVNGTAGSNVSVHGIGDLAFLDSLSASDIPDLSNTYVTLSGSSQIITSAKTFQSANITLRTAYLYPYSDGTCGIGAANKRFANIYGTYGDFSRDLTLSGNSTLYIGTAELSYDANTIALHLSGTDDESGRSVGLEVNDDAYIDIGKARLAYDDGAKALHITYKQGTGQTIGLYADGFVAAGGVAGQSNINFVTTDSSEQAISGIKKFTNLKVTNLSAISSDIALSGTINGLSITKDSNDYVYVNNNADRLYIQSSNKHVVFGGNSSNGCVFIGGYPAVSGYKLYVRNGDVYFADNAEASSWNSHSDRRLKDNITALSKADAIEKIMALAPSTWQWNSGANKGMTAAGFVAQDVEGVIPFMVGGKEYKSLAYQMLHAYEISALQSHEERITALEKRLTD